MADALDYHYGFSIYLLNFNEVLVHIFGFMELPLEMVSMLIRWTFFRYRQFWYIITIIFFNIFFIFLKKKLINKKKFLFLSIFVLSSQLYYNLYLDPKFLLFPQIITATALLVI